MLSFIEGSLTAKQKHRSRRNWEELNEMYIMPNFTIRQTYDRSVEFALPRNKDPLERRIRWHRYKPVPYKGRAL